VIKSIGSSFSLYSRIPMPKSVWEGEKPPYTLGFFPWVGAVIGATEYAIFRFLPVPGAAKMFLLFVLPLIITGGIHLDGFMDTADAFHSYGDKEKKLQILSDPHIGAFAVIRVLILSGLYLAGLAVLLAAPKDVEFQMEMGLCFALTFPLGRCASGLAVTLIAPAKKEGMAATIKKDSGVKGNTVLLLIQGIACIVTGVIVSPLIMTAGALMLAFITAFFLVERVKPLEGITGDLAGWYLCTSECGMLLAMAGTYLALAG
jgi:adenosylcobinamide-GDP ribazoletransferase